MNLSHLLSGRTTATPRTWEESLQGFTAVWTLSPDQFTVTITDPATDEPYLPFELKHNTGAFVSELRATVLNRAATIIAELTKPDSLRERVIRYCIDTYGTLPETPWDDDAITLNKIITHPSGRETQKWYGLIMHIKRKSLGEKDPVLALAEVDVMNVKAGPKDVAKADGKTIFPAYHMNKQKWLTIMLSGNRDWATVQELLDKSYRLVK
ncbi:MAG: MmcQ/YjbR family DNA-binding protein [Treponemataceae bacterium]|nr:MmcQ/YjbR family DNA-binding protein [Treponemataceae bacterium]